MTKERITAFFILVVGIALAFYVGSVPEGQESPFHLGLDLSGGTQLTYSADVSNVAPEEVDEAMSALRDVIERRVNLFGVSEPLVQVEEASALGADETEHRLIVELPGVTDIDEATRQLGETPLLEFELLELGTTTPAQPLEGATREDLAIVGIETIPTGLTGRFLESARLDFGGGGQLGGVTSDPVVVLNFNAEGAELFENITGENIGEFLAVFLDGRLITAPVIQAEIPGGTAIITGTFTPEEGRDLARDLSFGALPVPIELIGTQTIGATLGNQILSGGVQAGIWGLALVALFMILWYRLPGLVAVFALGIYVVVVLSLFKLIPVTLTAAGIAGFILSIGMAVDANVLIFERLKEELAKDRPMEDAITEGFSRAWLSIRDSNLSTLITAIILFWFGTSIVEGFALTLGVGIIISMLTAITVTRTLLLAIAPAERHWIFKSGLRK